MSQIGGSEPMFSLEDAWRSFLSSLPLVLLCSTLVGTGTFLVSERIPKVYEATAIVAAPATGATSALQTDRYRPSPLSIDSYVTLARSRQLRTVAGEALGVERISLEDISVSAGSGLLTNVIELTARGPAPQEAAARANALAASLVAWDSARIRQEGSEVTAVLREQAAALASSGDPGSNAEVVSALLAEATLLEASGLAGLATVVLAEQALPSSEPISPQPPLWAAIASVATALLVMGLVLLRATLDERLVNAVTTSRVSGMPVLTELPSPSRGHAAYFRSLSVLASQLRSGETPQATVVLVTSPDNRRSRPMTSIALAAWFATDGLNTTLVDADFDGSSVTKLLRLKRGTGFEEMLSRPHDDSLKPVSLRVGKHGAPLRVVPSFGSGREAHVNLATAGRVLGRISESAEVVVIDVPSPRNSADIFALSPLATTGIIVATHYQTKASELQELVEICHRTGLQVSGVVLVREDRTSPRVIRKLRNPAALTAEAVQGA